MFVTVSSELALGPKRSGIRGDGSRFAQLRVLSRCNFKHLQDVMNEASKEEDDELEAEEDEDAL